MFRYYSTIIRFIAGMAIFLAMQQCCYSQNISNMLLKNYKPVSIFNIPVTSIEKPMVPVIDVHSHDFARSAAEIERWVQTMDAKSIVKTIILSAYTGKRFDSLVKKYSNYKDRFDIWCGLDYSSYETPGWEVHAIAELERCARAGAKGVGELGDKGLGEEFSFSGRKSKPGPHFDDPSMLKIFKRCGELGLPVSIHIGEDAWMYLPPDSLNDGLMNGAIYHVDTTTHSRWSHARLFESVNTAILKNPHTIFILCHYGNSCADLNKLGALLYRYPNLYADISARFGEIAAIPRFAKKFIEDNQDKLLYGTDMGSEAGMYDMTFRILESTDEHFYYHDYLDYHWPLSGLQLTSTVLEKIYYKNAQRLYSGGYVK
ncbi:MAG: amidohydrolase family protein [Terrimonas sp.]|nr:amidohydrolase family protein [Terrimonas sp.]OJY98043.1 MAG: amidohydrolase [Sphingobacteriales bacterium 40-81]